MISYLRDSDTFSRQVYKYMIQNYQISGSDICILLFDQGILKMNTEDYSALQNGTVSAYDFIMAKIYSLEITPAMLALEPCTGSAVITDPNNGDVLACVTYPGYDNNRLANNMDDDYFYKLNSDKASPFYNKATQEVTAPGSTFKIVAATAGVMENVVGINDTINCTGKFQLIPPDVNCWIYSERYKGGSHGPLTLSQAITESCNFYFNTVGYKLGKTQDIDDLTPETDENGTIVQSSAYDDKQAIDTLTKYAAMYGFDANTGIEIDETAPHVSTTDGARTAMGQGGNTFTTSQLSRYAATIANSGTCYDLTLLDRITDSSDHTLEEPDPVVHSTVDLPSDLWDAIHTGMNGVYQNNSAFTEIKNSFNMAGKTGTAQENQEKPNHALFIGYAPYDTPEIAMAVRITNGYSSTNAASVAKDIVNYYFKLKKESEIITNTAANVNVVVKSLVMDGIFAGVGSVLSFLPIIVTLFFFLSLMEDSGYIARVAFVMDKLLRKIGLSGKSIVPMLIGFGCTVPAVMATRTLPSERDRKMTILLTPYMSCSAKLPIYAFFVSAFFPGKGGLIMAGLYFLGIAIGIIVAMIYRSTLFKGNAVPFVMELPNYRLPGAKNVGQLLWEKAKDFLQKAFTVIFLATICIWFLQSFDMHLNMVKDSQDSILAAIAGLFVPIFKPLGLGDWRICTSLISGIMAKESVVSTLEILFNGSVTAAITTRAAASLLVFSLLYSPCIAAIASIKREMGHRWAVMVVIWQCVVAWLAAFVVYMIGGIL